MTHNADDDRRGRDAEGGRRRLKQRGRWDEAALLERVVAREREREPELKLIAVDLQWRSQFGGEPSRSGFVDRGPV